jgi:kynurenine formamidase
MSTVVDLSQPLDEAVPMWPGVDGPRFTTTLSFTIDGAYSRRLALNEHTGTHVDAPAHMTADGGKMETIAAAELIRPAVVIDFAERCASDPDALLEVDDVERFERAHGEIPERAAVLVRTGWDAHRDDPARYGMVEGAQHFPGLGLEAAHRIVARRPVCIGIDTLGIDSGAAVGYPVHTQATLPAGVWHIEGLVNLRALPATGALLFVGALPLRHGSGTPARVLALLPDRPAERAQ